MCFFGICGNAPKKQKRSQTLVNFIRQSGIDMVIDDAESQQMLDEAKHRRLNRGQKRALSTVSVASEEEHQQTVVDSANAAKILQNLENLVEKRKKVKVAVVMRRW